MKLKLGEKILIQALLVLFIVLTLVPFLWTISTSFKETSEILSYPPKLLPSHATMKNYIKVLMQDHFLKFMLNSTIVTVASVAVTLLVSMFAGYGAARYNFPGKGFVMFVILAGMAVGRFANAMPMYFMANKLGLLDTYVILVFVYSAFIIPLVTWLMQSYYRTIPKTLEEAAKLDGCNSWTAFWRVIVPLMKPSIIAGGIIAATNAWNEFILALNLTKSEGMRTLPVALHLFQTDYGVEWGALSAASIISILPIVIIFLILQKYFVQGMTAGTLSAS
ncbi:carbohydrate ABC transporter permease [Clostridium sp. AM58-1XD]|uniref:carbohydrate ABC transporter permease n=1 Tax=Clostridium sp. AM58-1XD TaxID=2292307 RepID=UPI0015F3992A|nr:carbohydrate ABC transporter permease [Clostridium sp. AM58-1XD]